MPLGSGPLAIPKPPPCDKNLLESCQKLVTTLAKKRGPRKTLEYNTFKELENHQKNGDLTTRIMVI